jgi:hypothetical protein
VGAQIDWRGALNRLNATLGSRVNCGRAIFEMVSVIALSAFFFLGGNRHG